METLNGDEVNLNQCKKLMVDLINTAEHTIEIVVFCILHKSIVKALADRCKDGVRVRLVLYRRWLVGPKAVKHKKYVKLMKKSGVLIRWIGEDTGPVSYYRLIVIDCGYRNETNKVSYVSGDQTIYVKPYNLISDFSNLEVFINVDNETRWLTRFEDIWDSKNAKVPGVFSVPKRCCCWMY